MIYLAMPEIAADESAGTSSLIGYERGDVALLATCVFLTLFISFLCSVTEAALLSITPSYIAVLQKERPQKAALLKRFRLEKVDRSLAAILTLNTIANTAGAVVAGAQAGKIFGSAWLGLFSAVMTLLILFISEIIPKTLGAIYWQKLTGAVAFFLRVLQTALFPLILVAEQLTRWISRGKKAHAFNREEWVAMAGVGAEFGHINERESKIIRNLFRFGVLRVEDIMTPRTVITALRQNATVAQALDEIANVPFSRLPVYRTNVDEISGFVLKDDLLLANAQGRGAAELDSFKRELVSVIEQTSLSDLLELLLDRRQHIALVVGEYGETKGIVTLEDVLETLLGMEIVDEADKVEDMQALARQKWAQRAKALGLEVETPQNQRTSKPAGE
jgi:CBS domain containing-hemolysin-like protein